MTQFTDNSFTDSHVTTIGVDFRMRTLCIGNINSKIQIWDTAGNQKF